ncbi:MAG: hydroxyacid dehydrogenase [Spirochaetia bacterium]|nr:hydroxyacid dehydrogenase [Spirochaetia bacterium]
MKIWKNTSTLDGFDDGLKFTELKTDADVVLMGSKPIEINQFPNLKGIFRAGVGRDNVPEREAKEKGIVVRFPSDETVNIIFDETASFTCSLIFRMLYSNVGMIEPWTKLPRNQMSAKNLLVIGTGKIGSRVAELMHPFIQVSTFDILRNEISELKLMIQNTDCITIHIPKSNDNISFFDKEKLSWMKDNSILINTARGSIVDEEALFAEISKGRIKAAFDVYWQEPYDGKLKALYPEKFYMSPHVASTCTGFLEGCRIGLDELIRELSTLKMTHEVN